MGWWIDVALFHERFAGNSSWLERHVRNAVKRPQVRSRVAVTVETPTHGQSLLLLHDLHLVDSTVTARATNTGMHMHGVVEERVVRGHMHLDPFDRGTRIVSGGERLDVLTFAHNGQVTVHAGFGRRNRGVRAIFDVLMAVPAVHPHFASMKRVAVRDRLHRRIADLQIKRGEQRPSNERNDRAAARHDGEDDCRDLVRPLWEDDGQIRTSPTVALSGAVLRKEGVTATAKARTEQNIQIVTKAYACSN